MRPRIFVGIFAAVLAAEEPNAPPTAEEQTAMIAEVRQKALDYSRSLSDFLCTQVTRRYSAKPTAGQSPSWKPRDTLTMRLSYFQQREDYRVIMINKKRVNESFEEVGGFRNEGEFGSLLKDIFAPAGQAVYKWDRWSTLDGKPVAVVSLRIAQAHSPFHMRASRMFGLQGVSLTFGVEGKVQVDPETRQVLKVELHAIDVPPRFPFKDFQQSILYGYRKIGEREFLLPLHSESSMNVYGQAVKADTEFTDYRKFSADTDIQFGGPDK